MIFFCRKRPSARNRKPLNSQRDKIPNPSDVLSLCCCLCGDDQPLHSTRRSTATSSLKSRYLRLTCFIVMIIVIAVLTSVTVSLQRKVDSLNWSRKLPFHQNSERIYYSSIFSLYLKLNYLCFSYKTWPSGRLSFIRWRRKWSHDRFN